MNFKAVEKIADAVLYEGYILYPYRASAVKNRQRFNFGALMPEAYSEAQGGTENWYVQTECLVLAGLQTRFEVKGRFLHLLARAVYQIADASTADESIDDGQDNGISIPDSRLRLVEALEVEGRLFQTWQEAIERQIHTLDIKLRDLLVHPLRLPFAFPAKQERQALRDAQGQIVGVISRKQETIEGAIELQIEELQLEHQQQDDNQKLFKLTARIFNTTAFENANQKHRDEALRFALASAHTILAVGDGEFVSLLDTPDEFKEAAAGCKNSGTYPVLAGAAKARDVMLSSPIILYDYPQIIPGRYKAKIMGDVTMHGITRNSIWVMAQITLNGDDLRAQGDFVLRQTDFNIKLVSVAAGALKLKDEVKFAFELVGKKRNCTFLNVYETQERGQKR